MYVPLYVKTYYSLLSSTITIPDMIAYCQKKNLHFIAICDDFMYGAMEFYHACKKNDITPIFGLEAKIEESVVLLYAKNYEGYQNLISLSTIQSERRITLEDLKEHKKSLISIIPYFYHQTYEEIKEIIEETYIGITTKEEENEARNKTKNVVFCPMTACTKEEDREYLTYLMMIKDGKTVADDYQIPRTIYSFLNDKEITMCTREALLETEKIASMCNVEFPNPKLMLPIYRCENNMDSKDYLLELSKKGLYKRLNGDVPQVYKERLLYELSVIEKMGFSNYFLVVYDFIKYAKKNKILVGPGRGSAAGSLVSYTLGITDIDPIKYDLLFERFLNPERISMPDIDTDFPDVYRDQVISYVIEKYGQKNVAGIITFGTLGSKQAIRDVSRVLNIPLTKVDALCNLLPAISKLKLKDFYEQDPKIKMMIDDDMQLKKMYNIASRIEGFPRHTSSHAAGIVMSEVPLDTIIPLTKTNDMYLTSYSMEYLEELGLLKMDFLGLKNLTTIMNIIEDIEKTMNKEIDFNTIPMDDKETMEIFTKAETSGIFQFESRGMRNFLRKLKPSHFEDLIAAIALFRPGPAVNIDTYIRRKHGQEQVTYLDESLRPILENTYGILIYQEQIMQVARTMAGYTFGQADLLRRAMSKKKMDVLKGEEERFIKGSIQNGYKEEKAKEVFDLILHFANYGFNRAHSVAYSIIAYKMAYLKAKYKTFFFSNILSSVIGSETKTKEYIDEAKAMKIMIERPTISQSGSMYIAKEDRILFPLSNIKGVGTVSTKSIIEAREEGPFQDIFDALSRLFIHGVSRKNIESLIYADTFREFGYNKHTLIHNLDELLNYAELTKDLDPSFVIKPEIEVVDEYDKKELLALEKEVFGFYLSSHPASSFRIKHQESIPIEAIENYFNKTVSIIVLIEQIKTITTKKGDQMAFFLGSDETGTVDMTLFPKVYEHYRDITKGSLLKVTGNTERRMDKIQVVVNKIEVLES